VPVEITVLKFGGSSLADASAFERVARIVCACKSVNRVVVVSAMSGMTDTLFASARSAAQGELKQARRLLETHIARHLAVAQNLTPAARERVFESVNASRQEIESILNELHHVRTLSPRLQDRLVSYGEQLSAKLMTDILAKHEQDAVYVDARDCILTDDEHGAAQPLLEETRQRTRSALLPLLAQQSIPVLGGFFALSTSGATTTLGRGSSDYTATLVSAALSARETQIWTDVDGVMSADPHVISTARPIPWLSYDEAAELARFGGKVLHPKTIQPLAKTGIPLRVCNSRTPEASGTVISAVPTTLNGHGIKAVTQKTDITVIDFVSTRAFMRNGFRNTVEGIFHEHHATVDIVTNGEVGASLICEPSNDLPVIVRRLEKLGTVRVENDLAVICCVGINARTLETLQTNANIRWQHASSVSSIALVPAGSVVALVSLLHDGVVND
jgi:aspartate kinase